MLLHGDFLALDVLRVGDLGLLGFRHGAVGFRLGLDVLHARLALLELHAFLRRHLAGFEALADALLLVGLALVNLRRVVVCANETAGSAISARATGRMILAKRMRDPLGWCGG